MNPYIGIHSFKTNLKITFLKQDVETKHALNRIEWLPGDRIVNVT